ncbi:MAG: hypothetical protein WC792_01200 [Candidatus Micrarchaeia archaeon]|jgi:hypothetical protein
MLHASYEPFRKLMEKRPGLLIPESFQHDGTPVINRHDPTPREKIHNFAVEMVHFKNQLGSLKTNLAILDFGQGYFYKRNTSYNAREAKNAKHLAAETASQTLDEAMNHLPEEALNDRILDKWGAASEAFGKIHEEYRKYQIFRKEPHTDGEKGATKENVAAQVAKIGNIADELLAAVAKNAKPEKG